MTLLPSFFHILLLKGTAVLNEQFSPHIYGSVVLFRPKNLVKMTN